LHDVTGRTAFPRCPRDHEYQSGTPPFVHLVVEPAFGRFLLVAELADKSVQDLPDDQREVAGVLVNDGADVIEPLTGLWPHISRFDKTSIPKAPAVEAPSSMVTKAPPRY